MKNLKKLAVATLSIWFFTFNSVAQSIGINSTGATPDQSALLDLDATDKGFLITRVDTTNIATPAFGLMTLAPADSCLYMYSGATWISLGGVGSNCPCTCDTSTSSTFPCGGTVIPIIDVTNPITGKTWMDRNLGASQVATSSNDAAAYGDLYQWGRCSDGHEKRSSVTTSTLSSSDTPGHGDFIINTPYDPTSPFDWCSPQIDNLWQGVNGINNPCPTGYRIPTEAELIAERGSWSSNNAAGAFDSPLKLTVAGCRFNSSGNFNGVGSGGYYWSSTVGGTDVWRWYFFSGAAHVQTHYRAYGQSVRCIKD